MFVLNCQCDIMCQCYHEMMFLSIKKHFYVEHKTYYLSYWLSDFSFNNKFQNKLKPTFIS